MLRTRAARLFPFISTVLATTLFGQATPARPAVGTNAGPGAEPLVAEAVVGDYVFLPITIHNQSATVILDVGSDESWMFQEEISRLGIQATNTVDSITFGTSSLHTVKVDQDFSVVAPPGMARAVGLLGTNVLSHYDLVFDGPAQRMRMYKASADATEAISTSARKTWLPAGITAKDCVPLETDPNYPHRIFFPLKGNGHAVHSMFDSGSGSTNTNLAGARILGITKHTPGVRLLPPGTAGQFMKYNGQKVWQVPTGVVPLDIGPHTLTPVPLYIYQHLPRELGPDDPQLSVGLDAVRDRVLFISYSARLVCLGKPLPAFRTATVKTSAGIDKDLVLLTSDALAHMASFWTDFLKEPLEIREQGRQQHQEALILTLNLDNQESQGTTVFVVDMDSMAATYPSVAALLERNHFTAKQWERYRQSLFTAMFVNQLIRSQADTTLPPATALSTTGKNITFLRAHPQALMDLVASKMWLPPMDLVNSVQSHDYGGDLDP